MFWTLMLYLLLIEREKKGEGEKQAGFFFPRADALLLCCAGIFLTVR
jgi:hypothetical protein